MTKALRKALEVIVKVADPEKVIMFGSRARNQYSDDSDYDLLVIKEGAINSRQISQKIYLNFVDIGAAMDVIVIDSKKFENLKNDPFKIYYTINNEGLIIYEKH